MLKTESLKIIWTKFAIEIKRFEKRYSFQLLHLKETLNFKLLLSKSSKKPKITKFKSEFKIIALLLALYFSKVNFYRRKELGDIFLCFEKHIFLNENMQ
jgi:hypothetical protein